ncbi:DNA primase [Chitinophaga oryzae]|uniref:DNA primase n=1 Tax=Chitinophaga oryzae TaxID=2725414 RepID=A0ABX6LSF1_9BACT|nr:phage/plasmid primase, P4 family [Chitinophaga oryzae]QJB41724.1 DNA primase [Chitinophaga oryzae]
MTESKVTTPPTKPEFSDTIKRLTVADILEHSRELLAQGKPLAHQLILNQLLEKVDLIDFQGIAFPHVIALREDLELVEQQMSAGNGAMKDDPIIREKAQSLRTSISKCKLKQAHYLIICVEEILRTATANRWGICRHQDFIYLYNGAYWSELNTNELKTFLGKCGEKMGIDKFKSRFYMFRDHLLKQFFDTAYLPSPIVPDNAVFINLQNGTFEITPEGTQLRDFRREDFITYQLPFAFDKAATAPLFTQYLNTVLPDVQRQTVLAEYIGYVFIHPSTLKLEKSLLLYGSGANGKSVFFEVINALLGSENVCSYSLQSLTDTTGYYRANLANKLVNYASEINGNMEASIFKQLASGEPVEARQPYGQAFNLTHYAKLIFNCNELPRDVEHTNAYFRRFLIIPFDVTIPPEAQDKELSKKIIQQELSGVFNWVLAGLRRLMEQKKFSPCDAATQQLQQYQQQSDSLLMFLEDEGYRPSRIAFLLLKNLYTQYKIFCSDNGYRVCSAKTVSERLRSQGYEMERKTPGMVVYLEK